MEEKIKNLNGLRCFVANHIYGTMFLLKIGDPEIHLSDDESVRTVEGEWGITVEAAQWVIETDTSTTSSSNSESEIKSAVSELIGKVIEDVIYDNLNSRLSLLFSSGISVTILDVFQEKTADPVRACLWSLKTPHSIVSFFQGGKFEEEKEPQNLKKFAVSK